MLSCKNDASCRCCDVTAEALSLSVFRLLTGEEKRMADMEAAIESKDSRTRALLKEKEEKIIRVIVHSLLVGS